MLNLNLKTQPATKSNLPLKARVNYINRNKTVPQFFQAFGQSFMYTPNECGKMEDKTDCKLVAECLEGARQTLVSVLETSPNSKDLASLKSATRKLFEFFKVEIPELDLPRMYFAALSIAKNIVVGELAEHKLDEDNLSIVFEGAHKFETDHGDVKQLDGDIFGYCCTRLALTSINKRSDVIESTAVKAAVKRGQTDALMALLTEVKV